MSWSATQAAVIGATWIRRYLRSWFLEQRLSTTKVISPGKKRVNRSTKVSSDDFTQYHLSTSLAQIFPVGFAGTEAHEYSGVCIYGLSMASDHNYISGKK